MMIMTKIKITMKKNTAEGTQNFFYKEKFYSESHNKINMFKIRFR